MMYTLRAFLLLLIIGLQDDVRAAVKPIWCEQYGDIPGVASLPDAIHALDMEAFLALTPAKYKRITGHPLTVREALTLKAAQKSLRKAQRDPDAMPELAFVILALFGFGWVAMGLLSDWQSSDWIINLLLTFCCCWLPGLIHALVRMPYYYSGRAY